MDLDSPFRGLPKTRLHSAGYLSTVIPAQAGTQWNGEIDWYASGFPLARERRRGRRREMKHKIICANFFVKSRMQSSEQA